MNAQGATALQVFVPAAAAGSTVLVQALEPATCTVSNLLVHTLK